MICYYWPPSGGPGSLRAVKFARYLPQFGWNPVVLTVQNGEFPYIDSSLEEDILTKTRICRTKNWEPFFLYKKISRMKKNDALPVGILTLEKQTARERISAWIRANLFVPDGRIGWTPFAVREGLKIIKKEKIDLIFTSSPPHSLQLVGLMLKKMTRLPWVADLRDPWTDIRYYQLIKRNACIRRIDRYIEKKVLNQADHISTVSHSLASDFQNNNKTINRTKLSVFPNGYDEREFKKQEIKRPFKFQITHTGNLLAHQNPQVLWKGLSHLLREISDFKNDLLLRFIGRTHPSIFQSASHFGLSPYLESNPFFPHKRIIREMAASSILLVVIPDTENNRGIVTAKLFEYMGSGNPMLLIGPPYGDAAKIISERPNSTVCDYQNRDCCIEFIQNMYTAWKKNKLPVLKNQKDRNYSRREITKELATLFYSHTDR